jgi:hypothetical protein
VDPAEVRRWIGEYVDVFASCGRGDAAASSLLDYYAVPLLLTTDDGFFALTSADEVVAAMQQQLDGMRAGGYAGSEELGAEVTVVNATSALYRGTYSWRRDDGTELRRPRLTYLVTRGALGHRISVLAVESP